MQNETDIHPAKNAAALAKQMFSLIDLTSLTGDENETNIEALCQKAITDEGSVAAVCVYPVWIKKVKSIFGGHGQKAAFAHPTTINIATVANFPSGSDPLDKVLLSINQSIIAGADEIDVVFPYQEYLNGNRRSAELFVSECKKI